MGIFNLNFKYLRTKLFKETKSEFAKRLNEPEGKLAPYEQEGNPKQEFYKKLADELGIDLNIFLSKTLVNESLEAIKYSQGNRVVNGEVTKVGKVISAIDNLSGAGDDERKEIINFIKMAYLAGVDERESLRGELLEIYQELSKLRS